MTRYTRVSNARYPGVFKYVDEKGKIKSYGYRFRDHKKRQTEKVGFATAVDAAVDKAATVIQVKKGEYVSPSSGTITLNELQQVFVDAMECARARSYQAVWKSRWKCNVRDTIGAKKINDIDHGTVQRWVNSLAKSGLAPGYCRSNAEAVEQILEYGIDRGLLTKNPFKGIAMPRKTTRKTKRRYLSHQQVWDVASHLEEDHRAIFITLIYTGMRWGELAALQVGCVDIGNRRIDIDRSATRVREKGGGWQVGLPKAQEVRKIAMAPVIIKELQPFLEGKGPDDLVFPPKRHSKFRDQPEKPAPKAKPAPSTNWLWMACRDAGAPSVSPHELRHTFASLAVQGRVSVETIQRGLGHKTAALTLDTYADLFDSELDDLSAVMQSGWDEVDGLNSGGTITLSVLTGDNEDAPATSQTSLRVVSS